MSTARILPFPSNQCRSFCVDNTTFLLIGFGVVAFIALLARHC